MFVPACKETLNAETKKVVRHRCFEGRRITQL
jgi:hypothetical protein